MCECVACVLCVWLETKDGGGGMAKLVRTHAPAAKGGHQLDAMVAVVHGVGETLFAAQPPDQEHHKAVQHESLVAAGPTANSMGIDWWGGGQ